MRSRLAGAVLVLLLLVACGSKRDEQFPPEAKSELRSARWAAFFAPRSTAAMIRLGRAKLGVWDEDGAEQTFVKAYKRDDKLAKKIGEAYFDAAKAIAARSPKAVAHVPIIGRYVNNAVRWQMSDARRWYFQEVVHVLPDLDPAKRVEVYQSAAAYEDLKSDAWGLIHYIGEEINAAYEAEDYPRWYALVDVADRVSPEPDSERREWLARNFALVAKRVRTDDPEITRHSIERAQQLNVQWENDYELLDLRSRLAETGEGETLSDMQKTANQLIQIAVAATKYAKDHGEYPRCDSIGSFVGSLLPYTNGSIGTSDVWGGTLKCYVAPYGLYMTLKSPGPDGQFDRGEDISVWKAMHMTDTPDQADLSIEEGDYAPPWWNKDQVRALYR